MAGDHGRGFPGSDVGGGLKHCADIFRVERKTDED